jgi:hypothetical protein
LDLLRSRTRARHDSATIAVKQATRDVAATTGCEQALWEASYGLRRHRWYVVEFALDCPHDYEIEYSPVMGQESEGRAFTCWGAAHAAGRVLDETRAEERATRLAQVLRLTPKARVKMHALRWVAYLIAALAVLMAFTALHDIVHGHIVRFFGWLMLAAATSIVSCFVKAVWYGMRLRPAQKHLRTPR